jgi:hypothetical protein
MVKTGILSFASCFAFVSVCFAIQNGDFEQGKEAWNLGPGWSVSPDGGIKDSQCAKLDYDEKKKWSKISQTLKIEPISYYKLTFDYKADPSGNDMLRLNVPEDKKQIPGWSSFLLKNEWTKGTFYFYSGDLDKITFSFFLDGKIPEELFIDNVALVKLSKEDCLQKNLIINPDFEKGMIAWRPYQRWGKLNVNGFVGIDSSTGCLDGKQCLKLDTSKCDSAKDACAVAHSGLFPVVPGKDYILQFWAKAENMDTPLVAIVDSYITPHIPPHWYKRKSIMLDTSFRRYSMKVAVPDASKYPGLCRRLVFLKFAIENIKAKVWIDNISFTEEKGK